MRRYNLGLGAREYVIDVQELTADKFEVFVSGERYEVTLSGDEDLPEAKITPGYQPAVDPAHPASAPARPARVPAAATRLAAGAPSAPAEGGTLSAPMPGVILEIFVKAGDVVERGQRVAVLDAMKMHNLIRAPRAATIREVCVEAGQAVGHGDALVRYQEA
ncbi:MAG TPA: biotin/lipoyl-binding protein [Vicinamibacteria bacterium]|mgnify:CR=1 FL=1|nr:biotin/lipoyl-binding protein [Vicinamibacteria bacterium]